MNKHVVLSVLALLLCTILQAQTDTLSTVNNGVKKIDSLVNKANALASKQWINDSLKVESWTSKLKSGISEKFNTDSIGIIHQIDSLKQSGLPAADYEQKLSEYTQKLNTLGNKKTELLGEVNSKRDNLLSKTKGRLDEWKAKIKSKVNLDSLSLNSGVHVSDPNMPDIPGLPTGSTTVILYQAVPKKRHSTKLVKSLPA